jgi:DNA-binding NtrC family response regulator
MSVSPPSPHNGLPVDHESSPKAFDLLIVDDDDEFRGTVVRRFARRGFRVHEAADGSAALELLQQRHFDAAILDMVMPGLSGLDVLRQIREHNPECQVLLLTGQGTIESAVEAMRLGAYTYLTKPFPLAELEVVLQKALERVQLDKENRQLKAILARHDAYPEMVGESPAMKALFRLIERAGPTDKAILIQGESGTGKELVARALHRLSPRATKPLVTINCAALPETLLESELFGHEKGSFTGAIATKPGLFEIADEGTLFIDEIGEMPGSLQAKLLRVLEDGSMRRVGSLKERRVDVRLLVATNRDMRREVDAGRFRQDLYYRINVMSLELPPLRERVGDIPLLVRRLLGDWKIEADALRSLERYAWPGNVRQLINALDRARIMADGHIVRTIDLPNDVRGGGSAERPRVEPSDRLAAIERAHVVEILHREGGNKARAARALGVNRRSLYRLLEKHEIRPSSPAPSAGSAGA